MNIIEVIFDQYKVIEKGEFTLKSGQKSQYFFNLGNLNTGQSIQWLGRQYADKIGKEGISFDVLFGSAYKGIPIVIATAIELSESWYPVKWAFNRKEVKNHGDTGVFVGNPIVGKVLLIDDVLTSGKTLAESAAMIEQVGAEVVGAVVAVDRRIELNIKTSFNFPILSIVNSKDLL